MAYYNEISGFCCRVLRARIADGRLPAGTVDDRDVRTVQPSDIPAGQVHLFAGIGGFGLATRLAGLPDDFDIWTAGFPCQDISSAGRGAGLHGARSGLFFEIVRLLHGVRRRPLFLLLENVPALRTRGYDRVRAELEGAGYAVRAGVVGAWAVGAPHRRNRVWIVGRLADGARTRERPVPARPGDERVGTPDPDRPSERLADPRCGGNSRRALEPGREAEGRVAAGGASEGVDNAAGARFARSTGCEASGAVRDETRGPESAGRCGGMADADGTRPQEHPCLAGDSCTERQATLGSRWPSRPGEPQHKWEAPRLLCLQGIHRGIRKFLRTGHPSLVEQSRTAEAMQKELEAAAFAEVRKSLVALGSSAPRLSLRLVRHANRDALKAYGNSIVSQVAAAAMRAMLDADGRA